MKISIKNFFLCVFISLSLFFLSCSEQTVNTDIILSTGYKLSDAAISSLKEKFDSDTEEAPKLEINNTTLFYWTEGGTKIHLYATCQALSKSENAKINKGNLHVAYSYNKTSPCSFCLKSANLSLEEFSEKASLIESESTEVSLSSAESTIENDDIIYIWTKSGTKLHIFEDCNYLSNTDDDSKQRGNINLAKEQGITEICSSCQKNAQKSD